MSFLTLYQYIKIAYIYLSGIALRKALSARNDPLLWQEKVFTKLRIKY